MKRAITTIIASNSLTTFKVMKNHSLSIDYPTITQIIRTSVPQFLVFLLAIEINEPSGKIKEMKTRDIKHTNQPLKRRTEDRYFFSFQVAS